MKRDLEEGELTLTAAGYLQSAFDRDERRRRQLARDQQRGGAPVAGGMPAEGGAGAEGELQPDASGSAQAAGPEATPLNAAAKRELIERARGKSTRQVQELIAEFDPELVRPRDRLRALGRERWELKAVIDDECRRGLEHLRHWLSHVNPAMDFGELLQRLVADAVTKYDPAREPARARRQASATVASAAVAGSKDSERRPRKAEVGAAAAIRPAPARRFDRTRPDGCNQAGSAASVGAAAESQPAAPVPGSPLANTEPYGAMPEVYTAARDRQRLLQQFSWDRAVEDWAVAFKVAVVCLASGACYRLGAIRKYDAEARCGHRPHVGRGQLLAGKRSERLPGVVAVYASCFRLAHPRASMSRSIASAIGANSSYGQYLARVAASGCVSTLSSSLFSRDDPLRHAMYCA